MKLLALLFVAGTAVVAASSIDFEAIVDEATSELNSIGEQEAQTDGWVATAYDRRTHATQDYSGQPDVGAPSASYGNQRSNLGSLTPAQLQQQMNIAYNRYLSSPQATQWSAYQDYLRYKRELDSRRY